MTDKSIYEILEIKEDMISYSYHAVNSVYYFVHYYRMKNVYSAYVNKNSYHNVQYITFPYDYMSIYENRLSEDITKNYINHLRVCKNNMMNAHISNYRFFYYDRNMKMYYVTKNLIKQFFCYYELIHNEEGFSSESENICVQNLLRAYHLFEYIQNQEVILNASEFDRLINEKIVKIVKK